MTTSHRQLAEQLRTALTLPTKARKAEAIITAVADHHGVTIAQIIGTRGRPNVCAARKASMAITSHLLPSIGMRTVAYIHGRRSHESVVSAVADCRAIPWVEEAIQFATPAQASA